MNVPIIELCPSHDHVESRAGVAMFARWLRKLFGPPRSSSGPGRTSARPCVEALEVRITPSISIQFDYSYDAAGFFSGANAYRRAILQSAADAVMAQVGGHLTAIQPNPAAGDVWLAGAFNPGASGQMLTLSNLTIPADTLLVFAGSEVMNGDIGLGAPGTESAAGPDPSWSRIVQGRGHAGALRNPPTDFGPWGGSVSFDASYQHWFFGLTSSGIRSDQVDFWSVAEHEVAHMLGFGTAPSWKPLLSGSYFVGPHALQEYGGPVPVNLPEAAGGDWAAGTLDHGQFANLDIQAFAGMRVPITPLDLAGLYDVGWQPARPANGLVAVASDGGDVVNVYDAQTLALKTTLMPFGNFAGGVRVAVGDVNGDGTPDIICGAGPGGAPEVRVYDGRTFQMIRDFFPLPAGFTGGVFVAAGDVNGDGFADIVAAADAGGGPQVTITSGRDGNLLASFYATAPTFTGGVRLAVGDINGDGFADVIAAAGPGGGPQVTIFDGASLRLLTAFYALMPSFTGGLYVAAGDLNGDGRAEIIAGAEKGGGPQVTVFDGASLAQIGSFFALPAQFTGGVRVGYSSDATGRASILAAAGAGGGPETAIFDGQSDALRSSFYAFAPTFTGGLFVAGS
jgi:hypothetical protein